VVYGMGERAVLEIARRLDAAPAGADTRAVLHGVPGTAFAGTAAAAPGGDAPAIELPSHEAILSDPAKLMAATLALERQVHQATAWAYQDCGSRRVFFAPPAAPLSPEELDRLCELPFTRGPHPDYDKPIPAADMVQFSVTGHRGCGGGCSFCSLALHQGRRIRSRTAGSIRREVAQMTRHPDWKGSVTDVGGPSANMWGARCTADPAACMRSSCLTPAICPSFRADQAGLVRLLRSVERVPGVRHLRVASGVRFDLALEDEAYVRALVARYVGGQLKVAPEHASDRVLALMRKAPFSAFERFLTVFERESRRAGKEQYVVPYLLSALPGCTDDDMRALARWLKARGWKPQQVQCFIPTPGTVATAMYWAGIDTEGRPIPVARTDAERLRQHRILMPGTGGKPGARPPRPRRG
ncbi:MAG: radical SAM protein, partial [Candidatus Hydrogenedentes bacterium]|nr:radical SAM protein [Candidatus Hydrogenedentota bacterium]